MRSIWSVRRSEGIGIPNPSGVLNRINRERGRTFHPDAVDAFGAFAEKEYIWLDLRSSNLDRILSDTLSEQILETIKDFSNIAIWASAHHEREDGSGYPFHEKSLPIEARIIAVADVFTAITEDRPCRSAMNLADAANTLRRMSATHLLDPTLVELALTHRHELDEARRSAQAEASREYEAIMAQAV